MSVSAEIEITIAGKLFETEIKLHIPRLDDTNYLIISHVSPKFLSNFPFHSRESFAKKNIHDCLILCDRSLDGFILTFLYFQSINVSHRTEIGCA